MSDAATRTTDVNPESALSPTISHGPPGSAAPPPAGLAGYELLDQLGEGGMGVVYRARQTGLNRLVALKMVAANHRPGSKGLIRFLAEAEAIAAIRHSHVVQVYEYGEADGRPFLTLEYLPGGTLAARLSGGRLPPREAADLLEKVARGVAAAHDQGIIHRDLKPANILFDESGEPKVTDFGLAKRPSADLTQTQAIMGTPTYMAPEQAKGDAKFVGPQADVWALGVILYECLTGQRPFIAEDSWSVLQKVMTEEPPPARSLVQEVPRDLDLICRKCLAKDPRERYATAAELADELQRVRMGQPILARPAGSLERLTKWVRRNPLPTALVAAVVLGSLGTAGAALAAWDRQRQLTEEHAQRLQAEQAEENERLARQRETYLSDAQFALYQGRLQDAVVNFDHAEVEGVPLSPEQRLDRIKALAGLNDPERVRRELDAVPLEGLSAETRGRYELWRAGTLFGTDDAEADRLIRAAVARGLPAGDRAYAEGLLAPTTPEAVTRFRVAIDQDWLHQPSRSYATTLLLLLGRLDEATDLAEESARLFPGHPDFLVLLALAHGLQGDVSHALSAVDRLASVNPEEAKLLRTISPALAAAGRFTRSQMGYAQARPHGLLELVPVISVLRQIRTRSLGPDRVLQAARLLPPPHRDLPALYFELLLAQAPLISGRSLETLAADSAFLERVERATRAHPEGVLLYFQYSLLLARYSRIADGPGAAAERQRLLRPAVEVIERATRSATLFPVKDALADLAILARHTLGNLELAGGGAEPAAFGQAVEMLRERLRTWGEVPLATSEPMIRVAFQAEDFTLARQLLDSWERRAPGTTNAARWRAEVEFAAEAYPPALRAAEQVLAKESGDRRMQELRDAARARVVPREVAPPPRR